MPLYDCAGVSGGGGGGTSDYAQLSNLPQINNTTLLGNKSASDLGLVGAETGKGLSSNDYTNADKAIVDGVTSALAGKVDKVTGKGLSSNDYTDADKAIVDGVTSALAGKVDTSLVGSANGVAELDSNGRVPSSQLPSYVDDVLEYADLAHFPTTGETGKIYIAEDTNKTYRWSGSNYAEISESLALGETSSTAYAGNKGKANADAIAAIKDGTNIDSFGDVETALAGKANSSDLGDKSNLTTTDKSSAIAAINEVNGYFVDLGPTSGANINAFFKNACTRFLALSPSLIKPHSIFAEWSQHNNYFGQIVDINDDVVVATLTSAGGSQVISGYYRVTGDEVVVYPYSPSTRSYGAVVDISSYDTTTNLYTVPNDGMVVLAVNDVAVGAEVSLMDIDANLNMGMSIGNGAIQLVNSVMVIKGQRIYSRKINASNAAVYYRPLN